MNNHEKDNELQGLNKIKTSDEIIDERAHRDTEVISQQILGRMNSGISNPDMYNYLINKKFEGKNGIYNIESYFAEGGESVLFKGTNDVAEGRIYIVKVYVKRQMAKSVRKKYIDFLYHNNCIGIVPLLDYGVHNDLEFDVFPYIEKGDISRIKNMSIMYIMKTLVPQINEILRCIHSKGLVHGDINPRNILLDDGNNILLHDFTSLNYVGNKKRGAYVGDMQATYGYAAPEVLGMVQYTKSDYYALGITLLYFLNSGIDIYEGVEPGTIREKTIGDEIPGIDRQYFKNYNDKYAFTNREKILGLIHGLTIHNVNFRWGYEEVCKWCEGKLSFPVYIDEKGDCLNPSFVWKDERINSLEEMAVALVRDWDNAKIANERGAFRDFFASQRVDLRNAIDDIIVTNYTDVGRLDIKLFRVINTVAPKLPCICWKGKEYNDFGEMASAFDDMLPEYDDAFTLMLQEGVLLEYINNRENCDKNFKIDAMVKKQLGDIEKYARTDGRLAYNMFIMQFLPEEVSRTFIINKTRMASFSELVKYIETTGQGIQFEAHSILFEPTFAAWIWKMGGYDYLVKAMQEITDDVFCYDKAYVNLMTMLDNIVPKGLKKRVRGFVLKYNYLDYVIHLKDNLDLFDYNSTQAIAIRNKFQETVLDESISVNQIFKNLNTLYGKYIKFSKLVANTFDVVNGTCYTKPEIVPQKSFGCFVYEKDEIKYMAKYVHFLNEKTGYNNQIKYMYEMSDRSKNIYVATLLQKYNKRLSDDLKIQKKYYRYNIVKILYYVVLMVAFLSFISVLDMNLNMAYAAAIAGLFFPIAQIIYEINNIKESFTFDNLTKKIKASIEDIEIWNNKTRMKSETLYSSLNSLNNIVCLDDENYSYLKTKNDEIMAREKGLHSNNPGEYLKWLRTMAYKITGCAIAGLTSFGILHFISLVVDKYQFSEISKSLAILYGILSLITSAIILGELDEPHGVKIWIFSFGPILSAIVVILLLSIIRFILDRILIFGVITVIAIMRIELCGMDNDSSMSNR